jgi:hypothetical protein
MDNSKISIDLEKYKALFKGRQDVVPKHWNSKKGKSGYSPLCMNEWVDGLCSKPCRSCKNADYISSNDELIERHLSGQILLGVYPLLKDETCFFIAGDFDKHEESDPDPYPSVIAFVETCQVQELPAYALRSKSGNGYHVYLFFECAVPAWKARAVGFALLKEAGVITDNTDTKRAFDRLFPNQTRLSGKGLGNLIALPFQGAGGKRKGTPASKGHTLFLDPETDYKEPSKDQNEVLRTIEKVSEAQLDALIEEWGLGERKGKKTTADSEPDTEEDGGPPVGEFPLAIYSNVRAGCAFIKHCENDAHELSEEHWFIMITIVGRCKGGKRIVHRISEPYPCYNPEETDQKIEHAIRDGGPFTCEKITERTNGQYCDACQHFGKVKSPIVLGWLAPGSAEVERILSKLNRKHAVVMMGGKCVVINFTFDPVFIRDDLTFSSKGDFFNKYANRTVVVGKNGGERPVADVWWKSPNRLQYDGLVFDPTRTAPKTFYNLWTGFAFSPKKGSWKRMREHIEWIIADSVKYRAEWIVAWMARIVQDPGGSRPGTAIVLRGHQGTGKGALVINYGSIFGRHFLHISHGTQITGRFNSHLKDALVVFLDEAIWAGDKQSEGVIKALITEPTISLEQKHRDIFVIKNNVNLFISSNNNWVVPAGLEERRFYVCDLPDHAMQDKSYFRMLFNEMENGGREAMLYDLMNLDIAGIDLRTIERTEGLMDQILASMTSIQKYWFSRLVDGSLLSGKTCWDFVKTDIQYDDYIKFCEKIRVGYPDSPEQFGRALSKMCKGIVKSRVRDGGVTGPRFHVRSFPPLKECRKQFEELLMLDSFDWEEKIECVLER